MKVDKLICKKCFQYRGDIIFYADKIYNRCNVYTTIMMLSTISYINLNQLIVEYFYTEQEVRKMKLERINNE